MIKKLFIPVLTLVVALSLTALTFAQGAGATTLTGSIVDKACSGGLANKEKAEAQAAGHSGNKGCALKEACANSGLGVYADGKYYEFDANGSALAKAALEKSPKEKGAKFKVVGKVSEGKMTVESIAEIN